MICWTLDLNSSYNFDIETIQISFRRLRQTYANDRRLVNDLELSYKLPKMGFFKPASIAASEMKRDG